MAICHRSVVLPRKKIIDSSAKQAPIPALSVQEDPDHSQALHSPGYLHCSFSPYNFSFRVFYYPLCPAGRMEASWVARQPVGHKLLLGQSALQSGLCGGQALPSSPGAMGSLLQLLSNLAGLLSNCFCQMFKGTACGCRATPSFLPDTVAEGGLLGLPGNPGIDSQEAEESRK